MKAKKSIKNKVGKTSKANKASKTVKASKINKAAKVKKPVVVAVSGYFNPLHVGHLEMIQKAKKLGDELVAIINNDQQVALKGSVPFMSLADRVKIIKALRDVDRVFVSIDKDKTVCQSLIKVRPDIFANGGDRHSIGDVPEYPICQKYKIKMVDGLGKKIRASSQLIAKAAAFKEQPISQKKSAGKKKTVSKKSN
ncbi:adenylyltransferase/cytidyltransferase family protein [Candidatus Falkowbacteria bacterium]|jgi:cytidyltransferase-like protein|nr:adenylyltransferase/cytidyltransferase family protein [Candidatus Falkowbacteria bacterium]